MCLTVLHLSKQMNGTGVAFIGMLLTLFVFLDTLHAKNILTVILLRVFQTFYINGCELENYFEFDGENIK